MLLEQLSQERVHFAGSGAEAVETAIKMARTQGKDRLVAMYDGYHGKTMGALSLTGKEVFQAPFRPLLPGVHHVPFGDAEALDELLGTIPGRGCVVVRSSCQDRRYADDVGLHRHPGRNRADRLSEDRAPQSRGVPGSEGLELQDILRQGEPGGVPVLTAAPRRKSG